MSDFFRFEEEDKDFPFYNGKPKLSILDWTVLLAGIIVFIAILEFIILPQDYFYPIAYFLATFLPLAYVSRGKLGLFFRKLKKSDISLIIKCLIGYFIYSAVVIVLISYLGASTTSNAVFEANMDIVLLITAIIQIMGEELFKICLLLVIMFLIYKLTKNRKMSLLISALATMLIFGLMHHVAYGNAWAQVILVIGIGSGFYLYAYLKTKNVWTSFLVHLLIDGIAIGLSLIV